MERLFLRLGALSALLAVAAGAFAAHALRLRLPPDSMAIFETAARYQMYHALGLIVVSRAVTRWPGRFTSLAGWLFVLGTVLFSGSLYALSLTGSRWLGIIAPMGGIAFLTGWLCLALSAKAR
jgi:uncharacterized membrane protein YgdD (TMEM256/DUF423 family)